MCVYIQCICNSRAMSFPLNCTLSIQLLFGGRNQTMCKNDEISFTVKCVQKIKSQDFHYLVLKIIFLPLDRSIGLVPSYIIKIVRYVLCVYMFVIL